MLIFNDAIETLLDPNDISLESCDVLIEVFVILISPNFEPDAAVIVPPYAKASEDTIRPVPLFAR